MSALAIPDPIITEAKATVRRWTRGEFDRMLDADIFPQDDDVALRDGQIYRWGEPNPRLWTRSEYYRLAEAGILGWDERVELQEGDITEKVTIPPPHAVSVSKTGEALRLAFRTIAVVREQTPSEASAFSEPEPDVLVAPGSHDDYAVHHPPPAEALLVVEVSDTTLRKDRGKKARIYAVAGCREYWIVNLQKRTLEVSRSPAADGYENKTIYTDAETVTPLEAPHASVRVADLLPLAHPKP